MVCLTDPDAQIVLHRGKHDGPDDGHCLLEVVSMLAGEPFSDHPECVDPVLGGFGRAWNDGLRSDVEREQLRPYAVGMIGTAGDSAASVRRGWMALDWSVRVSAPAWLELAGLSDHAVALRGLPPVDGSTVAGIREPLVAAGDAARAAAGAAARAAAWAAAGAAAGDAARAAARDAARAAAWAAARAAAGDAAGDAATDAARAAAWAAAGDAAWAAARDAARAAARDAARDAAGDALEPVVRELQTSAHDLFRRMIHAGPHNHGWCG